MKQMAWGRVGLCYMNICQSFGAICPMWCARMRVCLRFFLTGNANFWKNEMKTAHFRRFFVTVITWFFFCVWMNHTSKEDGVGLIGCVTVLDAFRGQGIALRLFAIRHRVSCAQRGKICLCGIYLFRHGAPLRQVRLPNQLVLHDGEKGNIKTRNRCEKIASVLCYLAR